MELTEDELIAWLKADEEKSRLARSARLRFLVEQYGPLEGDLLFHGGVMASYAFREARLCFLNGLYVACVMMAEVFLEHTLGGLFSAAGRDDVAKTGFAKLSREALVEGLISEEEFEVFEQVREHRNPYAHPRTFEDESHVARRAVAEGSDFYEMFEKDAALAVGTVLRLMKRHPHRIVGDER